MLLFFRLACDAGRYLDYVVGFFIFASEEQNGNLFPFCPSAGKSNTS